MSKDPPHIEACAAAEHTSWSNWMRWQFGEMEKEMREFEAGGIPHELADLPCVQRWKRQMNTPYAKLSEREKESDRKVAREKLEVYRLA